MTKAERLAAEAEAIRIAEIKEKEAAERAKREAGTDSRSLVGRVYALAYGRPPAESESDLAKAFVDRHGLSAFCRVIFNSNEFIYVY